MRRCAACYDTQPEINDEFSGVKHEQFSYSPDVLRQLVADGLRLAKEQGASGAEIDVSEGYGLNVTVRKGEVETIEHNRDKGFGATVYFGQRRGHASSSDLSPQALRDTMSKACSIARHTAEDPYAGLPDEALLLRGDGPDLDLYHPWPIDVDAAVELAKSSESAALAVDKRITNSDGASVSSQGSHFMYGNSLGFTGGYYTSRHGITCSVIAEEGESMQRDDWYSVARDAADLEAAESVGRRAGERSVQRLHARKIGTRQVPVLFEAPLASGFIGHFVGAVSGGSLYRKSSFLLDSLGKKVFSDKVQILERPHLRKGLGSGNFDSEGVATRDRDIVKDGVLQGYFLGSYSARKLGMQSTGNAGGTHNLLVPSDGASFEDLLKRMGTGLLVTELLGHGINQVTGDYSRGASGYWVEGGTIQYPVEEITIAGNLKEMYMGIIGIGNDIIVRGSRQCGSILVERMTVAGE